MGVGSNILRNNYMKEKVSLGINKKSWITSPLPGQIVIVTTMDMDGIPNAAPKSWISMVALEPPIIGFGCNLRHQTAKNILQTKEFVINTPSRELASTVWKMVEMPHKGLENLKKLGLTLIPSLKVAPPSIEECKAHIECIYDSMKEYGEEVWIFGKIVQALIDKNLVKGSAHQRYSSLNSIFYLERKTFGELGKVNLIT